MKTSIKTILFSLGISATLVSNANTGMGICNYGSETVDNITCYGVATLNGTAVTGKINVSGPLTLINATVNSINVNGPLTLINATVNSINVKGPLKSTSSTIRSSTLVVGVISATNTNFESGISATTSYIELDNSKVNGDIIENSSNKTGVLKMSKSSTVSGNVTFSAESGVVKVDKSSDIHGSIINGTKSAL